MLMFLRSAGVAICLLSGEMTILVGRTLSIAPSADTYFEAYGSEKKNYGTDPILRMDQWGGRQVFLRFPLTELTTTRRILGAKLRLFITQVGFNEVGEFPDLKTCVGLYDVATAWTEKGLTFDSPDGQKPWNQGPGIPGPKYTDVGPLPRPDFGVLLRLPTVPLDPARAGNGSWLELDVTDFIRQRIRAGDREVNLVVRSSTLGRNYTFRSREAQEVDQRPQLAIALSDELPDFHLANVLRTDWKSGEPLSIGLKGLGEQNSHFSSAHWALTQVPGGS